MARKEGRCKYKLFGEKICNRKAIPNSKNHYCICHEKSDTKDIEKFNKEIEKIMQDKKAKFYDFRGFYFPKNFDFEIIYKRLKDRTFKKVVDFRDAKFQEQVDFIGATFQQANFMSATFQERANFMSATFQEADFIGATFQEVNFLGATFQQANFLGATFQERACFMSATFQERACFMSATFQEADFIGATFQEADFIGATFQEANFLEATFQKWANFRDATFQKWANFLGATFQKWANFMGATFQEQANFMGATFQEQANFMDATFQEQANFMDATFKDGFLFIHIEGVPLFDFMNTIFSESAIMRGVKLNKALFNFSRAELVDLTGAQFPQKIYEERLLERDELNEEEEEYRPKNWEEVSTIYRKLKQAHQRYGDYGKAGEFYYREMECKKKAMRQKRFSRDWVKSFGYSFLKHSCGYGEKPLRVLRNSLLFVLGYALAYLVSHSINLASNSLFGDILQSVYFSTITFTTLGYGDIHPITNAGRVLAMSEAVFGAIFIALFIFVFGRKMMR